MITDAVLSTAGTVILPALKISPGALVFCCNTLPDVPIIADLQWMQQQALIDENLMHANHKRTSHCCQPGDKALL
jgi:hypothetical protein